MTLFAIDMVSTGTATESLYARLPKGAVIQHMIAYADDIMTIYGRIYQDEGNFMPLYGITQGGMGRDVNIVGVQKYFPGQLTLDDPNQFIRILFGSGDKAAGNSLYLYIWYTVPKIKAIGVMT